MTRIGIVIASAAMAAAALTSTMAQAQFSEPAAFLAQNPNRDVLNGGQLTPAGRAALGQPPYEGLNAVYGAQAYAPTGAPVVRPRHRRRHQ
jgi:hypothetical protein